MINSPKPMVVVFWSPLSFPVIQVLPPKMTFTAKFFVDNSLPDIAAAKPACGPIGDRLKLMLLLGLRRVGTFAIPDRGQ
jgi:hypothetical protein